MNQERKDKLLALALVPIDALEGRSENVRIKDEFNQEKAKIGPPVDAKNPVNWEKIEELCEKLLKNGVKDLSVICIFWLALFRQYGLEGLEVGCDILTATLRNFWEEASPKEQKRKSHIDYAIERMLDYLLPTTQYQGDSQGCLDAIDRLQTIILDKFADNQQPKIDQLKNELTQKLNSASTLVNGNSEARMGQGLDARASSLNFSGALNGYPQSREEAFEILSRVSQYFADKEPHSPIPYLLDQAISWGQMKLPELISELLANNISARDDFFRMTGIKSEKK